MSLLENEAKRLIVNNHIIQWYNEETQPSAGGKIYYSKDVKGALAKIKRR